MKNKKLILGILLFLIIVLFGCLITVLAVGSNAYKQEQAFFNVIENAACDYVEDEHLTYEIWENYSKWQKISMETLIENGYIDKKMENPITKEGVSQNNKAFVQISFEKRKIICKYNEE